MLELVFWRVLDALPRAEHASPLTSPLLSRQFFDFISVYSFFGLRTAASPITFVWVAMQVLVQVNVIVRNSGTADALAQRGLAWLWTKLHLDWATNCHHPGFQPQPCPIFPRTTTPPSSPERVWTDRSADDPIFRLQFLGRLGIQ